jgi:hypothetical protein
MFKVGYTYNIDERMMMLQSACPTPIELIYLGNCKSPERLEKHIHQELLAYHSHGEWFDLPKEMQLYILQILKGATSELRQYQLKRPKSFIAICMDCGKKFMKRSRHLRYCSAACKQRAYRIRKGGTDDVLDVPQS